MNDTDRFIRREIIASIVMGALFSLLFFVLAFRLPVVPVWGQGGYVMDFLPQGFFVALMSVLWPGMMARRALRRGAIKPLDLTTRLPRSLVIRALLMGVAGALFGAGLASGALALAGIESLGFVAAGVAKTAWGGALAAVVTPLCLRATLAN